MQSNYILKGKLPHIDYLLLMLASLFVACLLLSCKPTEVISKEYLYVHDTVYRLDTTLVVKSDSIWMQTPCRDTVIFKETPRMVLKTIVKDNVVYVQAHCKEQQYYISKEIAARTIKHMKHDTKIVTKYRIPFYVWILFGIIAVPAVYGGFKIVTKYIL